MRDRTDRARAEREDECVVGDPLAGGGRDLATLAVDGLHGRGVQDGAEVVAYRLQAVAASMGLGERLVDGHGPVVELLVGRHDHDVEPRRRERAQREQRLDGGDSATRDHDTTLGGGCDLVHASTVRPPRGGGHRDAPAVRRGRLRTRCRRDGRYRRAANERHDAHTPDTAADDALTRVVIADDHAVVRAGLRLVLDAEDGIEVVAEVGDAEAAARAVLGHRPHVLVLDLNMPGEPSLEAIPQNRRAVAGDRDRRAHDAAGPQLRARGAALRRARLRAQGGRRRRARRRPSSSRARAAPTSTRELGARMAAEPPPSGPPDGLTERELEVLRMIALGHTNTEIAAQLYLSVRTVESHRAHIQQKIRRSTRAELVRYALDHKLIEQGD